MTLDEWIKQTQNNVAISYKDLTMAILSEKWNPSPQSYQALLDDLTKALNLLHAVQQVVEASSALIAELETSAKHDGRCKAVQEGAECSCGLDQKRLAWQAALSVYQQR